MQDFFYVKNGGKYSQVFFSDILYIESKDKYATLITSREKILILQPLHTFEKVLPSKLFCRIHRSFIVSLAHTKWFDHNIAFVGNRKLPIGKHYREVLSSRVLTFSSEPNQGIKLSDYDILTLFGKIN